MSKIKNGGLDQYGNVILIEIGGEPVKQAVAAVGMRLGAKPPAKCRLAPIVKLTNQESGGQWDFSNFDRFCS